MSVTDGAVAALGFADATVHDDLGVLIERAAKLVIRATGRTVSPSGGRRCGRPYLLVAR